jgi:hypothetical protein
MTDPCRCDRRTRELREPSKVGPQVTSESRHDAACDASRLRLGGGHLQAHGRSPGGVRFVRVAGFSRAASQKSSDRTRVSAAVSVAFWATGSVGPLAVSGHWQCLATGSVWHVSSYGTLKLKAKHPDSEMALLAKILFRCSFNGSLRESESRCSVSMTSEHGPAQGVHTGNVTRRVPQRRPGPDADHEGRLTQWHSVAL